MVQVHFAEGGNFRHGDGSLVGRQASNVKRQASSVKRQTSSVKRQASNVKRQSPIVNRVTFLKKLHLRK
ncbi:MAG: hypothetical protein D6796_16410 [Caldilineae bacterium]|nr:MAG: hypothetical protein D6796_16410 [Caldilineae bacterium]